MNRRGIGSIVAIVLVAALAGCGGEADKTAGEGKSPAVKTPGLIPAMPGGGKGSDLEAGPVATPLKAMWTAQERIKFIEIGEPLKIFKIDHDRFPKSHEEFMKEVVQKHGIPWPAEFIYDPAAAANMTGYDPNNPPFLRKQAGN
jgi:hypothetical protein